MRDIEQVIQHIASSFPQVKVQQLRPPHPGADDDGLWFFQQPLSRFEVQVESSTGMCPFLIETDETDRRLSASSVTEAVEIVLRLLHLASR